MDSPIFSAETCLPLGGELWNTGDDMRLKSVILGSVCTLAALVLSATSAQAVEPLSWSLSYTYISKCTGTPCFETSPSVTVLDKDAQYGHGINAQSSSSDPTYGVAHGRAESGSGYFDLPQLHADVTGMTGLPRSPFAVNFSIVDGVQSYKWTGLTGVDLGVDSFIGAIDYTNSTGASDYGGVNASLAIISGALRGNAALGSAWFARNPDIGFAATCATEGAIAIGSTGLNLTKGAISSIVAPTCGTPTFHLEPGDEFFVWARLYVLHASTGFTDASNTFSVRLSPDLTPTEFKTFTDNVVLAPPLVQLGAIPEPATWAMMILGFGLMGSTLRRRAHPARRITAN